MHSVRSGSGVLHDDMGRLLLGAKFLLEESIPKLFKRIREVKSFSELGFEDGIGAEAGLDHEQLRRPRGVTTEERDAGGWNVNLIGLPSTPAGGGEGGGGERRGGRRCRVKEGRREARQRRRERKEGSGFGQRPECGSEASDGPQHDLGRESLGGGRGREGRRPGWDLNLDQRNFVLPPALKEKLYFAP